MKNILQKIAWKTRRWNLKISFFDLFLHDGDGCWGFTLFEVVNNYQTYALLAFECRLPNGADIRSFTIDSWDILFISNPMRKWYLEMDDRMMWGHVPSTFKKMMFNLVGKIVK